MMESTRSELAHSEATELMRFKGIDYLELYVGNVYQAVHFYRTALGFIPIAFSSFETGERDRTSFILQQGDIRLILTSANVPDSAIADHVKLHGDGVKDIVFAV